MSSLHQDHLLVEGPETADAAGSPLAPARGTSRRATGDKVPNRVPTQRHGKAQSSGSAQTTADGNATAPRPKRSTTGKAAEAATGAAGTIAARAKAAKSAASGKAATAAKAKAATARAATSKAATAAKAAAVAKVATRTSAPTKAPIANPVAPKPAVAKKAAVSAASVAKPVAAKPAAAKPVVVKAAPVVKATSTGKHASSAQESATAAGAQAVTTSKAGRHAAAELETTATTHATSAVTRPTPYKRTAVEQPLLADDVAPVAVAPDVVAEASDVVESVATGRAARLLRRRPPTVRRRPALYLAAALVGSLGVSVVSTTGPAAQATDSMSSVSVAQELGLDSATTDAVIDPAASERLEELAVSRNERDAEQAAAADAQAKADEAAAAAAAAEAAAAAAAAAEAARPKAVLPVNGARFTSGFGARWGTVHAGIDLAAPIGTPEYAAMDGVVLEAGPASGFGLAVYIQHDNGDVTVYGHMEQILVQAGQVVKAGETIALLGNRGQSTGPHLHFEVHVGGLDGQKIDPVPWLKARGVSI